MSDIHILSISDHRPQETIEPLRIVSPKGYHADLSQSGFIDRISSLFFIFIRSDIRKEVDAILLDGSGATAIITYIFSKMMGKTLIFRLGGNPYTVEKSKAREMLSDLKFFSAVQYYIFYILTIFVLEHSDGVLAVSSTLREEISEKSDIGIDKIEVVKVPIRSEFVQRSGFLDDGDTTILTVTNLSFEKKFEGVVRALEIVRPILESSDNIKYTIVGGGRYYPHLKGHVDNNYESVSNQISLLGFQENVAQVYAHSDIFFYISYIDAYPNVVLEAMSSSLPVVTNDMFGMQEQVVDGHTGYVCDANNKNDVRVCILNLINDCQLRSKFGDNGLKKVLDKNTSLKVGEELVESIENIHRDSPNRKHNPK